MSRIRAALRPESTFRRRLVAALLLATIASLVFAGGAFANFITPESGGSPNADQISSLYKIILYIAIVVFVVVEGALLYSLVKFRARRGRVAAQIHGNTRLELGWTMGAAAILLALAIITFAELHSIRTPAVSGPNGLTAAEGAVPIETDAIKPPKGPFITIQVNGQQYIWRYTYANYATLADGLDAPFTYRDLYVPTNTVIRLKVVSQDVVHSWWVPALGGKVQADPGFANYAWFIAPHPGTYTGQCSFICGRGHARMTTVVIALTPSNWLAWLHGQEAAIRAANAAQKAARAGQQNQTGAAAVEVH